MEEMKKVITKHGKGSKTISKKVYIPVTMIINIMKKFKIHGNVANFSGHGCKGKIIVPKNRTLVEIVEKELRRTK